MGEVFINGVRYIPEEVVQMEMRPFSKAIFAARKARDETLEDAAKRIGTTKSHLHTLESGVSVPRLPMLQRILRHYGLSFDQIADENYRPNPPTERKD